MKPPFYLLIGAQKAGTTAIYGALRQIKTLNLARVKESKFFIEEDLYKQGLTHYLSTFFPNFNPAFPCLDVDPDFMLYSEVPQRILNTLGPDTKFILVLRNPAVRAYSAFLMESFRGNESESFEKALALEPERNQTPDGFFFNSYIERGKYAKQLKHFLAVFPIEQFLFLSYEKDFIECKEGYTKLLEFMGLDVPEDFSLAVRKNVTQKVKNKQFDQLTRGGNTKGVRGMLKAILPKKLYQSFRKKIFGINIVSGASAKLKPHEYLALNQSYFAEDIAELTQLTGIDFSYWLK